VPHLVRSDVEAGGAARRLPHVAVEERESSPPLVGFFIVVACAATLHEQGTSIEDAADAAVALEPFAGRLSSALFGAGLLGAALLAASILPLSTAYSVGEAFGTETALDSPVREARVFYGTFAGVVALAAVIVLIPRAPLVSILYLSQALNAILLLPLLVFMYGIARDRDLMGDHRMKGAGAIAALATLAVLAVCVGTLAVASLL
jgi:Mn2+/Fe2+ NRAMP family transporter